MIWNEEEEKIGWDQVEEPGLWDVKEHRIDTVFSHNGQDDFFVDSYKESIGLFGSFGGDSSRDSSFLQELAEDSEPLNAPEQTKFFD